MTQRIVQQLDLGAKQQIERDFHDIKAKGRTDDFYSFGALQEANNYLWASLGDFGGKRVLEIGCGDGSTSVRFARGGAKVTAIDISGEMVKLTKRAAEAACLEDSIDAVQMSGEDIEFPDSWFDVIYGHSVLHHLDLDLAMPKLARILKSGGRAAFLEPLGHNPFINFFRYLTPGRRTPTERPLRISQLQLITKHFARFEHQEFYLFSLAAFMWYYLLRNEFLFRQTMKLLVPLDKVLFRVVPLFRKFAWTTVLICAK